MQSNFSSFFGVNALSSHLPLIPLCSVSSSRDYCLDYVVRKTSTCIIVLKFRGLEQSSSSDSFLSMDAASSFCLFHSFNESIIGLKAQLSDQFNHEFIFTANFFSGRNISTCSCISFPTVALSSRSIISSNSLNDFFPRPLLASLFELLQILHISFHSFLWEHRP